MPQTAAYKCKALISAEEEASAFDLSRRQRQICPFLLASRQALLFGGCAGAVDDAGGGADVHVQGGADVGDFPRADQVLRLGHIARASRRCFQLSGCNISGIGWQPPTSGR